MELNKIYSSLFYPLSGEHSNLQKVLSVITICALSILTGGLFAIAFAVVHWRDRQVKLTSMHPKVLNSIVPVFRRPPLSIPAFDQEKVNRVKAKQAQQLMHFEQWAHDEEWQSIHDAHYDWWMFPVKRPSAAYGEAYAVSKGEVEALQADAAFMNSYRRGVGLVVLAWGWNLEAEQEVDVPNPGKGQKWTGYGVRLAKMSDSLRLFGETELHKKLGVFFKRHCLPQQDRVPISDLVWLNKTFSATNEV